jgi:hypothetical protein
MAGQEMLSKRQQREGKVGLTLEQELADTLQLIKWMLDMQEPKKQPAAETEAAAAVNMMHRSSISSFLAQPSVVPSGYAPKPIGAAGRRQAFEKKLDRYRHNRDEREDLRLRVAQILGHNKTKCPKQPRLNRASLVMRGELDSIQFTDERLARHAAIWEKIRMLIAQRNDEKTETKVVKTAECEDNKRAFLVQRTFLYKRIRNYLRFLALGSRAVTMIQTFLLEKAVKLKFQQWTRAAMVAQSAFRRARLRRSVNRRAEARSVLRRALLFYILQKRIRAMRSQARLVRKFLSDCFNQNRTKKVIQACCPPCPHTGLRNPTETMPCGSACPKRLSPNRRNRAARAAGLHPEGEADPEVVETATGLYHQGHPPAHDALEQDGEPHKPASRCGAKSRTLRVACCKWHVAANDLKIEREESFMPENPARQLPRVWFPPFDAHMWHELCCTLHAAHACAGCTLRPSHLRPLR